MPIAERVEEDCDLGPLLERREVLGADVFASVLVAGRDDAIGSDERLL
jgi:hypothetical protein